MSISARLATGTILLLALAGCTENRMMDGSSPALPPPSEPAAAKVWVPIRSCVRPAASSRNACVPAPTLTTYPAILK